MPTTDDNADMMDSKVHMSSSLIRKRINEKIV